MRAILPMLVAAALPAALAAQQGSLGGPVTAMLVEESGRTIRPMIGIPGAAYAGKPLLAGAEFALAAPAGDRAVLARSGRLAVAFGLNAAQPQFVELSRSGPIAKAAWSADSASLAVFDAAELKARVWTGLSGTPALDASYALEGAPAALAVSGSRAAAVVDSHSGAAVYLLAGGEDARLIARTNKPGPVVFDGDTLYYADRARGEVYRYADGKASLVAGPGSGLRDPVGLALSENRKVLYVAGGESRSIVAIDLATGLATATLALDFTPTRLEAMRGGWLFLLDAGAPGVQPAQILDTTGNKLRVFFVPFGQAE